MVIKHNKKKVEVEREYIMNILCENKKLNFQYPPIYGSPSRVAKSIEKDLLKKPKPKEIASLVYESFNNQSNEYASTIIKIFKQAGFYQFVGNLWLPKTKKTFFHKKMHGLNNGVIVDLAPDFNNGKIVMNKKTLIDRLHKEDPNVKFIPYGFKTQDLKVNEFLTNPYLKAIYGEKGIEKILRVAFENSFSNSPYYSLWLPVDLKKEQTTISKVSGGRYFGSGILISSKLMSDEHETGYGLGIRDLKD